ncbi:unnamed protein product [Rotaria socialis]|uniref:Uncharacterized protein n=2 Tax=Rotaria socialis TaxID=392032 RepID=A0A821I013_9BILA|nr:unnamed protein product [Rotaria socialis]CAF4692638.1 unnamed protein product [Rotaria socialis]CAF4905472.1 unnamed protein product [Rotaria socialis]
MKARTKQTLLLVFRLAIYLLAWETLITNTLTIFVQSLKVTRGSYYEVIDRQIHNTSNEYTDYLYAIKDNYTVLDCTEPIGPVRDNNFNYRFLKQPISLIFFWIGQLIMIAVSSADIFCFIQQYRRGPAEATNQSTTAEERDCCMRCKSCCDKFGSILMKVGRIVFVSTTYAVPAYYMANFDYKTPCLTPYPKLFLGDTGLIFYYGNLSVMVVISTILLWRQIRTGIPETVFDIKRLRICCESTAKGASFCALLTCNRKAIMRAALLQIVMGIAAVGLFGSMVIFFTELASKTDGFATAVNGGLRMGFSVVAFLGNLDTIACCDCCR